MDPVVAGFLVLAGIVGALFVAKKKQYQMILLAAVAVFIASSQIKSIFVFGSVATFFEWINSFLAGVSLILGLKAMIDLIVTPLRKKLGI